MSNNKYVIGLDFGTDSVRAVLVDTANGNTIGSHVHWYARWKNKLYCDASINQYRQHPKDHEEGIIKTITGVLEDSGINPNDVKGICIDTTGSSPIALDDNGTPLCYLPEFAENPNAMVVLWKDHTAIKEAELINTIARTWGGTDFTKYEGGIYSSEWFWAKILHINKVDAAVKLKAHTWMEHCDLMTYLLIGSPELKSLKRSRCAAGHKAMWHADWGGLPDDKFLERLEPGLTDLKSRLYSHTYTSDQKAGLLSPEWADKLGLSGKVVVSVGTFDAHAGAVGAEVAEGTLVRVMGTSTCDIIVSSKDKIGNKTIPGICGQVDGSVIPGLIGLEAGQSAFGDVLAWFKDVLSWPIDHLLIKNINLSGNQIEELKNNLIEDLSKQADAVPLSSEMPIALDWINGRRTPDADQSLKTVIANLNLGTKAPEIFRALVEAICFGSRAIVERFIQEGVEINEIVGIGGVAKKSDFIMQTLADVLDMPIKIATSNQAPALGAAMYAATAAGIHENLSIAINKMGNGYEKSYFPRPEMVKHYNNYYKKYQELGSFAEQLKQ